MSLINRRNIARLGANMTILQTEQFERVAEKIAALEPCPFFGVVTADQVKIALVELDIIPASVADEDND